MARPEGFEPPTPRFVVWCSIQLSYGRRLKRRRMRREIPAARDSYRLCSNLARLDCARSRKLHADFHARGTKLVTAW
jgi:hypothetical protein